MAKYTNKNNYLLTNFKQKKKQYKVIEVKKKKVETNITTKLHITLDL